MSRGAAAARDRLRVLGRFGDRVDARLGELARHAQALREDVGRDQAGADAVDADVLRHRAAPPSHASCGRSPPWRWNRAPGRSRPADPATDAVEMIEPPPCARIAGTAYFMPNSAARTCRCMTRVEAFGRDAIGRIARAAGAGIVEQDVEPAEMLRRGGDAVLDVLLTGARRSAHSGPCPCGLPRSARPCRPGCRRR